MPKHNIPLRERKYAQTKQAILNVFLEKLRNAHLEEVSVKDICDEVQISEGTFFNYFPKKSSILVYYIANWSIETNWYAKKKAEETNSYLAGLEEIYAHTARMMQDNIPVMFEVIALIGRQRKMIEIKDINRAEKLIAFKGLKGAEEITAFNFHDLTKPYLESAVKNNELPKTIDIEAACLFLRIILFGVPMALGQVYCAKTGAIYDRRLKMLWHSLKAKA